jgi:hypothetical protein
MPPYAMRDFATTILQGGLGSGYWIDSLTEGYSCSIPTASISAEPAESGSKIKRNAA